MPDGQPNPWWHHPLDTPLIVLLYQRWKHMTILRMVIMHLILFFFYYGHYVYYTHYVHCSMVGVNWFPNCIWAWSQKASSLCHSDRKYPGKASGCASWWHRDNSASSAQSFPRCTWRPQAGFWRWMQDVVRQFVGFVVVPWFVMKERGTSKHILDHFCCLLISFLQSNNYVYYAYYTHYTENRYRIIVKESK